MIIDDESEALEEEEDESSNGDHENNVTDHTMWRIKMPSLETVENLTWNSRYEERTYEDLCYVTFSSEVIWFFTIFFSSLLRLLFSSVVRLLLDFITLLGKRCEWYWVVDFSEHRQTDERR